MITIMNNNKYDWFVCCRGRGSLIGEVSPRKSRNTNINNNNNNNKNKNINNNENNNNNNSSDIQPGFDKRSGKGEE